MDAATQLEGAERDIYFRKIRLYKARHAAMADHEDRPDDRARRAFLGHAGAVVAALPLMGLPAFARVPDEPPADADDVRGPVGGGPSPVLHYRQPAKEGRILQQGLPIGNGRMGALVGSDPQRDFLYLSDASLWLGGRNGGLDAHGDFPYGRDDFGSFVMLAKLYLELDGHALSGLRDYRRTLDLGRGILRVSYARGDTRYTRTVFASHPDDAIVMHLSARGPGRHDGSLELRSAHGDEVTAEAGHGGLGFGGRFANGLRYGAVAGVAGDGTMRHDRGRVRFEACRELTVVLCGGSNYVPDIERAYMDAGVDPRRLARERVRRAMAMAFRTLLQRHVADHRHLFDRMHVDFGPSSPAQRDRDTWQRLRDRAQAGAAPDPELEAAYLQFGRYLTIAGSRDGLPTNLQGLWLGDNRPPWMADYHTDVNLEMNYWLPDRAGLGTCFDALTRYCLAQYPSWVRLTRQYFNDPRNRFRNRSGKIAGWTVAMSLNIYGGEGWWWQPASNAWLCNSLWQHYQYTRDRAHLERIHPLLKGACEFWQARLVEITLADAPGGPRTVLVDDRDWSPEQGPTDQRGVTYAQELVWDLFGNYRQACAILSVDHDYAETVAGLQARLYLPRVSPATGRLEEWMTPADLGTPEHRHLSPLVGFFPGDRIRVGDSPAAMVDGVRALLRSRGMHSYGWANAWRGICWARLKDAERAYQLVTTNLVPAVGHGGTAPNLFNSDYLPDASGAYHAVHPSDQGSHSLDDMPADGGTPVFQIDANYGTPVAMLEMLLYSRPGHIEILPALPAAWAATGRVTGIGARGGFVVDIAWRNGRAVCVDVHSVGGTHTVVGINGKHHAVDVPRGGSLRVV
jgi:alpha-L-fucosidase 2